MTLEPSIHVCELSKAIAGSLILRSLDFDVAPGDCITIQGTNGSGKSTLLACLAGLIRPTRGTIRVFGRSPGDREVRRLTGMVAHESHLFPSLSIRENLLLVGRMYGVENARRRAEAWIRAAGLERRAGSLPSELSQGMRRRASIARAMLHDPRLLILDEPQAGLDRHGAAWLSDLLSDRVRLCLTTVMVTHPDQASCPPGARELVLHQGRLHQQSPAPPAHAHPSSARALREAPPLRAEAPT